MDLPRHKNYFINTGNGLNTSDGKTVEIVEINIDDNAEIFSEWANHMRKIYCNIDDIDALRTPFSISRAEYLRRFKIPDQSNIISGEFAEILVADYINFLLNYIVPRTRYHRKDKKNASPQGTDIIGFKFVNDLGSINNDDIMITCEVKAAFSNNNLNTLQEAADDSIKDFKIRQAESLNAIAQRLRDIGDTETFNVVQRFQNKTDKPFKEVTGAAIVHSTSTWDDDIIEDVDLSDHPNYENLNIIAIRGDNLMQLANLLYQKVCDEA